MSGKDRKIRTAFGLELFLLLFLICFAVIVKTCSDPPPAFYLKSGIYSAGLIMAYDEGTTEISGIFRTGDSCNFYLVGKLSGNKINMVTWHPEARKGKRTFGILRMLNDKEFQIYLEDIPGYCPSGKEFTEGDGMLFVLKDQKPWQRLRSVKFNESFIFEKPDTASRKLAAVSRYDLVKVVEKNLFWVKVTYGNDDEITGWVEKDRLFRFPG